MAVKGKTISGIYEPVKIKVYFEHSIWNRLVEDVSKDEKKAQQNAEIQRIVKFRDKQYSILIFTSEAVMAELFPLEDSGKGDLRKKIEQKVRNIADGLVRTEYNQLGSSKFARLGFTRFPTDEFIDTRDLFISRGFKKDDAVHLATALTKQMDIFLTVDEKTIWKKRNEIVELPLKIKLPIDFIRENSVE